MRSTPQPETLLPLQSALPGHVFTLLSDQAAFIHISLQSRRSTDWRAAAADLLPSPVMVRTATANPTEAERAGRRRVARR